MNKSSPYTKENVRKGILHFLIGRGLAGSVGFLNIILLVRIMEVSDYAIYTALSGVGSLIVMISSLGLDRVLSRYIPEARLSRSADELASFIWLTAFVKSLLPAILVSMLWLSWGVVNKSFNFAEISVIPSAFIIFVIFDALFQHFSAVMQSLVLQKELTKLMAIQWGGRLLLILFFSTQSDLGWKNVFLIFAIPELIAVLVFVIFIYCYIRKLRIEEQSRSTGSKWPQWSRVFDTARNNYIYCLLAIPPQGAFVKTIIATALPADYVAAYGFFSNVAEKIRQYLPLYFFYGLFEPVLIAKFLKEADANALFQKCHQIFKTNLIIIFGGITLIAISGQEVTALLTGGKYQHLYWILMILIAQYIVDGHVILFQMILNTIEKSKILMRAGMFGASLLFISMLFMYNIQPYYLFLCPIVFSAIVNLYILFSLRKQQYIYAINLNSILRISLSSVAAILFTHTLIQFIQFELLILNIATTSVIAMTIYAVGLFLLKSVNKMEWESALSLIKNKS